MKKIKILIIGVLLVFFTGKNANAHTMKSAVGSESIGYIAGPQHPAKKSFDYAFASASSTTITAVRNGAGKWNGKNGITITEKTPTYNSKNHVKDYSDKNTTTIAYNSYSYNTSTNVISSFSLNFNSYYMNQYSQTRKNQIAMHEWGHTFGLKDLYNSSNKDKALYGYGNSMTATSPTSKDISGMYYGLQ